MCRLLGYLGQPLRLRKLIEEPPHSLEHQSYRARELTGAVVNADGWGFGWYVSGDDQACVYRSILPIWADVNRAHLGRAIESSCFVSAVRSATDPLSVSHANTPPFVAKHLLFAHNGYIKDFAPKLKRKLRCLLSDERYAGLCGDTDSEHIFALFVDEYARATLRSEPEPLARAVQVTVQRIRQLAAESDTPVLLTLVATDGSSMMGLRAADGAEPPSLYVLHVEGHAAFGGTVFASEPLDGDASWQRVEPETALLANQGALRAVPVT
jgi:glutamine amidotransferase